MALRVLGETLVGVLLAAVLAIAVVGLFDVLGGTDPVESFFGQAPSMVLATQWPALLLWLVLVLIGNIRNRHRAGGWKFLTNMVSVIAALVVNLVVVAVIAVAAGGWGLLLVGIALAAAIALLFGAAIALALTHFVFFRRRSAQSATAASPATV